MATGDVAVDKVTSTPLLSVEGIVVVGNGLVIVAEVVVVDKGGEGLLVVGGPVVVIAAVVLVSIRVFAVVELDASASDTVVVGVSLALPGKADDGLAMLA